MIGYTLGKFSLETFCIFHTVNTFKVSVFALSKWHGYHHKITLYLTNMVEFGIISSSAMFIFHYGHSMCTSIITESLCYVSYHSQSGNLMDNNKS